MQFEIFNNIFGNTVFFLFLMIVVFALLGWATGSFSVGLMGGFLMFVNFTVKQNNTFMTNLLYISMVAILFFTAFRMYGYAFSSGGVES